MTMPELNDAKEQQPNGNGSRSLITQDHPQQSAIDSLFYEQGKLRADLDRLLRTPVAKPAEAAAPTEEKKAEKDGPDAAKPDASKDEDKDAPKEPFRKRAANWTKAHPVATVAIPILLVAVLVGRWFLWGYLQSYESTDDAQVDGHVNAISSRISGTVKPSAWKIIWPFYAEAVFWSLCFSRGPGVARSRLDRGCVTSLQSRCPSSGGTFRTLTAPA